MECRARFEAGTLRLMTNRMPDLADGEVVLVSIERARSGQSHRHQFAWIKDAWASLPESVQGLPWAETPETLRKHALIATGFHQTTVIDCGARAAAQRVKAALVAAEGRAHGYALAQVRGPVVTVWTPESQSRRAMGGERFRESKNAILDWIAAQLGVPPQDLARVAA
jgi:hypothetical protein